MWSNHTLIVIVKVKVTRRKWEQPRPPPKLAARKSAIVPKLYLKKREQVQHLYRMMASMMAAGVQMSTDVVEACEQFAHTQDHLARSTPQKTARLVQKALRMLRADAEYNECV